MRYPSGRPINIGDNVIYDEGEAYGYVIDILESESDYRSYGLDCPSLILGQVYPESDWIFTSYPEYIFSKSGLELQSNEDISKIQELMEKARLLVDFEGAEGAGGSVYSFSFRKIESHENQWDWQISIFRDQEYCKSVFM